MRSMRKVEETSLHLVYPLEWKNSLIVSAAKWASQTYTEFGAHVKVSVLFPVVTPTKTNCFIKQRLQSITLMKSWFGCQWTGEDIHTDRAHFQSTYSKFQSQRRRGSVNPDQLACSYCWCVSVMCLCVWLLAASCLPRHLSLGRLSSEDPGGSRQRGALSVQTFCWPPGKSAGRFFFFYFKMFRQTKHIKENTNMSLLKIKLFNSVLKWKLFMLKMLGFKMFGSSSWLFQNIQPYWVSSFHYFLFHYVLIKTWFVLEHTGLNGI